MQRATRGLRHQAVRWSVAVTAAVLAAPLAVVATAVVAPPSGATAPPGPNSVQAFGAAASVPGAGSVTALPGPTSGIASTPDGNGYWVTTATGQVTAQGDAGNFGSLPSMALNAPVLGMASTGDGGGYWLVAADGGIFSFGDAQFYGSTGSMTLNQPVVGMAAVPGGGGYWLVAADGGIFSFGSAQFYGSTGAMTLDEPVAAMAPTSTGGGYWLLASDGGIFSFGNAGFAGSGTGGSLTAPAVGIATRPGGYWIAFGQTADWGSPLGQEELLAGLGYLPLSWSPQLGFRWRWPNIPPQLAALWSPGQSNMILEGAIWAFEAVNGLPTDGRISSPEIGALLSAANNPSANMNPNGYTYSLAQEHAGTGTPESLTVWHTGGVVQATAANTGISAAPTTVGTFPVYVRYRNQVMTGVDPTGTPYADPVQFVSYFTGGDAIHFMPRASYGYPQSLGCVEIPIGPASVIWQYTYLGSLVTVTTA
jgi:hypothetical protein